jgi:hypothetical protein
VPPCQSIEVSRCSHTLNTDSSIAHTFNIRVTMEEKVALNGEEQRRRLVLSKVVEGKLVGWQAVEILGNRCGRSGDL